MFFTLKKKLMAGAIAKRNLKHSFDFVAAENYTLDAHADPLVNPRMMPTCPFLPVWEKG